ncbi:MAG TPA: efflux RND transporter periplasmic adaptor subunit [Candidatus Binataceae bacterium]|nr:efflux RND transporter periplasmic adaptor subunit [Candidatus Binataceae bacterium]
MKVAKAKTMANKNGRWRFLAGSAIAVLLLSMVSGGIVLAYQMRLQRQTDSLTTKMDRGPRVLVEQINPSKSADKYEVPVTIRGYVETPVYAKVAGYLKKLTVDKGDRVHKGEVIAVIESPETDKQVNDAKAAYLYQSVTDRRFQYLVANQVISQESADDQHSLLLEAKASYQQELALQSYEVVTSQFDGVVTARYVDPGVLIAQSTTPSTVASNTPIIWMATLQPLRVFAYVPQTLAPLIHDGDSASVSVEEYPGQQFDGTVTRHPEALDPASRTMLVEVDLPNRDLRLMPGMYGKVRLTTSGSAGSLVAPDDALIFLNDKVYLPIVRSNHLHLVEVKLGHDNGIDVGIFGDIHQGDLIAINVGQAASDGEAVQPVQQDNKS